MSLLAVMGASALCAPAAGAQGNNAGLADPPANIPRTPAIEQACASGSAEVCQGAVVQAIDEARASEDVGPLVLPSYFDSLSVAEQILVLADLERVDRGLPGFAGLSSSLDALAYQGADSNNDPNGPSGQTWGSNWAGGEASALLADFDWMYDDGYGSPNEDCTNSTASGCWDHRHNILGDYGPHPSMGAAATKVDGVTSMTELFSSGPAGKLDYVLPKDAPATENSSDLSGPGYWEATSNGKVLAFAGAGFRGSAASLRLAKPVVGIAATPNRGGYWEVAADGGVFSFGDAHFYGSAANLRSHRPFVGIAVAHGGHGYWLATSTGDVYSFGAAAHFQQRGPFGRAGEDVVGITATPDGLGYWLVGANGVVHAFGDAHSYGPDAPLPASQHVVGMASTLDGHGYWLVTRRGFVYTFGDARFYGSLPGQNGGAVVGMAVPTTGHGYYVAASSGRVFAFGSSSIEATAGRPGRVVAMAAA